MTAAYLGTPRRRPQPEPPRGYVRARRTAPGVANEALRWIVQRRKSAQADGLTVDDTSDEVLRLLAARVAASSEADAPVSELDAAVARLLVRRSDEDDAAAESGDAVRDVQRLLARRSTDVEPDADAAVVNEVQRLLDARTQERREEVASSAPDDVARLLAARTRPTDPEPVALEVPDNDPEADASISRLLSRRSSVED